LFVSLFVSAAGVAGSGFMPGHRRGRGSSPQWKEHYSKVSEKWGAIAAGAKFLKKVFFTKCVRDFDKPHLVLQF